MNTIITIACIGFGSVLLSKVLDVTGQGGFSNLVQVGGMAICVSMVAKSIIEVINATTSIAKIIG